MSQFDSTAYWLTRHQEQPGLWQSVGFKSGSSALNDAFYLARQRGLDRLRRSFKWNFRDHTVLDVGCGLGYFSQYYYRLGAKVCGIDISPIAISACSSLELSCLFNVSASKVGEVFQEPFDFIHCFDVLYHVLDDNEWSAILEAFAKVSHVNTIWVLTEIHSKHMRSTAPHVKKRSLGMYQSALAKSGRKIVLELPLYWLYSVSPRVAKRFPFLLTFLDPLGHFVSPLLREYAALWVVIPTNYLP
jgi:2-polyprenyl-3-methyl-5-hydroxy-6-metoxy-1,4-benzoquinol methylase